MKTLGGSERGGGSQSDHDDTYSTEAVHPKGWSANDPNDFGSNAKTTTWTTVGRLNPKPIKLNPSGIDNILHHLLDDERVKSARQAVAGEGLCMGSELRSRSICDPKARRSKELVKQIADDVRSHEDLSNLSLTSILINHNTTSAPHADNNLKGLPSTATCLGAWVS